MGLTKVERRLGFTPAFLRIAFYYLRLGEGVYHPANHPHYDRIIVREFYEFGENPRFPGEYAGGMIVEFFQRNVRVKFVEFRAQVVGCGGDPIIRVMDPASRDQSMK